MGKKSATRWPTSPVEVSVVQALQVPDLQVDVVQLRAQVLGLLRVGGDAVQLLNDPLSQADVLVVEGVQVLARHLGVGGTHKEAFSFKRNKTRHR